MIAISSTWICGHGRVYAADAATSPTPRVYAHRPYPSPRQPGTYPRFSARLRELIGARRGAARATALAIGVTETTMSVWLSGRVFPRPALLSTLALHLGVTAADLACEEAPAGVAALVAAPTRANRRSQIRPKVLELVQGYTARHERASLTAMASELDATVGSVGYQLKQLSASGLVRLHAYGDWRSP